MTSPAEPAVSVVIPTYNRADLLGRTLASLAAQQCPDGWFEVVVADDGSSDSTAEVVGAAAERLPVRYYHQEDRGFRAATARNGGARLATAPVLVFLDTGVVVGSGFVRAHHQAHRADADRARPGAAVIGYTYGYDPYDPHPGLDELLASRPPEQVVASLREQVSFRDTRHAEFAATGFALDRLAEPWTQCWSVNLSVHADDFWAVGGFDEEFTGWGAEDIELGYRLARRKVTFQVSRDAWAVESPHDRDNASNLEAWRRNLWRFLDKQPSPAVELFVASCLYDVSVSLDDEHRFLAAWTEQSRVMDVHDELAEALGQGARPAGRIAAFGCGAVVPASWPADAVLFDFDRQLLDRAQADRPGARCRHGIGISTLLPDQSVELVVVSSRLAGLWDRWSEVVLAEAFRIGRDIRVPLLHLGS